MFEYKSDWIKALLSNIVQILSGLNISAQKL